MGNSTQLLHSIFGDDVGLRGGRPSVANESVLESARMDQLVRKAVFGDGHERELARWLIWQIGQSVGVRAASIHDLYMARGRGEIGGFTAPAINVRGMSYDTARSIFRTAVRMNAADATGEVAAVKQLANEAIHAGFYNIDVDTSTLVDVSLPTLDEQQRKNYETAVDITAFIREREPRGVTISVGGEIGEVGGHNSTVPELRAFMDGFNRTLRSRAGASSVGLSKISVQTGTSH